VDIEANNFGPVYAIQSGRASIRYPGTGDVNVDVGRFFYWHINPAVRSGQWVTAYKTVIGQVDGNGNFDFYDPAQVTQCAASLSATQGADIAWQIPSAFAES